MLALFNNIKEVVSVERENPETNEFSTLHTNVDAAVSLVTEATQLGGVPQEYNQYQVIFMEAAPLDLKKADVIVTSDAKKLKVLSVVDHYYANISIKAQILMTEEQGI